MNNYLSIKKQAKKSEVLQENKLNKVPVNYREILRHLLLNHCNDDKFLNLLLFQKCNIENCKIFKNENEFYDMIQFKTKFFHRIYQFEISKRAVPAENLNFKTFYLSVFNRTYNKKNFDFNVRGYLYIVFLYHNIKKEVQIMIYNGLSQNSFDELINDLDKLQSKKIYHTSTLCYT